MPGTREELIEAVKARVGPAFVRVAPGVDMAAVVVRPEAAHDALRALRDDPALAFVFLADLTCVDYLGYPLPQDGRFAVVYHLHSFRLGDRLRVTAFLPTESPRIRSAADLWGNANWLEREIYDLFGIRFDGHPDLRRILMPDDYSGHPLRKDYPLRGRGERDAFPAVTP